MDPTPLTLTELATMLARSWRVLVTGAVVGLLVALAVHAALPTHFRAVTSVRVDPIGLDPVAGAPAVPVDMEAEAASARSRRVVDEARASLGRSAPDDVALEDAVEVTVVRESSVLRMTCEADDPEAAARGADAVAHAYLAARSVDATARADRLRDRLRRQLSGLDGPARADLEPVLHRLELVDLGGGAVVDPARVPTAPTRPRAAVTAVGGALLGTLMACVIAVRRPTRTAAARAS